MFFSKENPELESRVLKYFEKIEEYNKEKCEGKLCVILLGSLSRGEGSWAVVSGKVKSLSDIEYFTVYPDDFSDFSGYTSFCKSAADEIFGSDNSSLFHIDNTFVKKDKLPLLERKLITFDAKQMGKNVVGEGGVELLPDVSIKNINMRDIQEILVHRVFSVIYWGFSLKEAGKTEEYRYSLAKNSLDLMTVILMSRKILVSGLKKRFEEIKKLGLGEEIENYFSYCLSVKLSEESDFDFTTEQMEDIFVSLVKKARKEFKVPLKNAFINFKYVLKRNSGKIKRMVKYRFIPDFKHLDRLVWLLEKKEKPTDREIKANLVLHGYPVK